MSSFPSPTDGTKEFAIVLSGTGITGGNGEYFLTLAYQGMVVVTATVVDVFGAPISDQPVLTATSYNGPPSQSGEASNPVTLVSPNSAGQEYRMAPTANGVGGMDVLGIGQTGNVANVTASAPFTVTITGIGEALIQFRTPMGRTARLNVQGIQ